MADDQAVTTLLRYSVDTGSVTAAVDANGQITASYDDMATAGARVGLSAEELASRLGVTIDGADGAAGSFDDLITKEAGLTDQTLSLSDAYDKAAASMDKASQSQLGANDFSPNGADDSGGFSPSTLTTAGRLVGGQAGHALRAVGQASRLADSLPEDSSALLELGSAALVAAPALVLLDVAVHQFQDELKQDKAELDAATAGLHTFYAALGQGSTTEQVTQQITQLNNQRAAEAEELSQIQRAQAEAFKESAATFGDLGARLLDTQTPVAQLRGEAEKLQTQLDSDTASVKALTDGVQANAFAAADAANKEKTRLSQEASGAEANVGYQLEAQNLTASQRAKREFDIQQQLAVRTAPENTAFLQAQPQAEIDAFNLKTQGLQAELADLQAVSSGAADAFAKQAEADKLLTGYASDAAEADKLTSAQRQQRIAEINTEINADEALINQGGLSGDAVTQLSEHMTKLKGEATILGGVIQSTADKTAALNDQFKLYSDAITNEGKISESIVKTQAEISKLNSDEAAKELTDLTAKNTKIAGIEAQAGLDRAKIIADGVDAVNKIERDANRSKAEDVRSRNVDAYLTAVQAESDKLADQKVNEDKALAQENANVAKQEQAAKAAYDLQISQLRTSLTAELSIKHMELQSEQSALTKALYDEQVIATYGSNGLRDIHTQLWTDLNNIATGWANLIKTNVSNILGGFTALPPYQETSGSGSPFPNAYQNALNGVIDRRLTQIWEG